MVKSLKNKKIISFNISIRKFKNTYLHVFWDLITSLLNPWEFDQYFNNQNFNLWKLMINYSGIER